MICVIWFTNASMWNFPGGSEVKASASNVGDLGSIPGSGRSTGEGNGNPLWYSCLENPMDGGAWWATVHGVAKSQTRLSDFTFFLSNASMLCAVLYLVAQPCPTFWDPMDCSPPGSSVHGDSPGKNIEVGCQALLQGIFPTQGSNQVSRIAGGFLTIWATRDTSLPPTKEPETGKVLNKYKMK